MNTKNLDFLSEKFNPAEGILKTLNSVITIDQYVKEKKDRKLR